jgi:hypothetical protein
MGLIGLFFYCLIDPQMAFQQRTLKLATLDHVCQEAIGK